MLAEVSKYGVMIIRRVYGDWTTTQLKSWKEVLHTYALKPEQQFSYTTGKNATDSALIIDAMDIIYTANVDGICIVSSDSDYTRLATRIREKNLFVMGIGEKKTPRAFVNACDVFVYTENLQSGAENSSQQMPPPITNDVKKSANAAPSALVDIFRTAFELAVQEDGWAHLGRVGQVLRQNDPGFDPRTYGYKLLSQLAEADPRFIEIDKRKSKSGGESIYIRLKTRS
jgi:predicted nuclease of predicted toxin-antitoxin system